MEDMERRIAPGTSDTLVCYAGEDPFKRRGLARTPPWKGKTKRTSYLPDMVLPRDMDDDVESEKRKRAKSPPEEAGPSEEVHVTGDVDINPDMVRPSKKRKGKEGMNPNGEKESSDSEESKLSPQIEELRGSMEQTMEMIGKAERGVKGLLKLVKENINTKLEIKKGILELERVIITLGRRSQDWMDSFKRVKISTETKSKPEVRHMGTQVDMADINRGRVEEMELVTGIRKVIEDGTSYKDLEVIMDVEWPDSAFQKVNQEEGGLGALPEMEDVALIINLEEQGERCLRKQLVISQKS